MKRAEERDVFTVNAINPRDYTENKHKKVDDTPYGGGAGMVLMPQPYVDAYESVEKLDNSITVMLSPQGEQLNEKMVLDLAKYDQIIMLCGHYEGFDERIINFVDEIISIGDYVLTGGEIPAMVVADSCMRLVANAINKDSLISESFENNLLDYPVYTKPKNFKGYKVPKILVSGNHQKISE
jgi:tRNA (guanine37-N1)-methyltransferase